MTRLETLILGFYLLYFVGLIWPFVIKDNGEKSQMFEVWIKTDDNINEATYNKLNLHAKKKKLVEEAEDKKGLKRKNRIKTTIIP